MEFIYRGSLYYHFKVKDEKFTEKIIDGSN